MLYVSMVVFLIFICKEVLDPADYRPLGIEPSHDHSLFLRLLLRLKDGEFFHGV
jgi:hypothetical protein